VRARLATLALFLVSAIAPTASALEVSGYVAAEGSGFLQDPLYSGQKKDAASFAVQPEFYHEWKSGSSFIFVPFARVDSADDKRTHFDIRELNYLYLAEKWEVRAGIGKVFWGATEFVHLVDIINQTDFVESIDFEEKLGQPMINLSIPGAWGVLDLFALPYFRERTFPGRKGRLRFPLVVDTDNARYESADKERHVDFAARYSKSIGDWEIGLSNFNGTGREPTLLLEFDPNGGPVIIPYYEQINQTGLDVQLVAGEWLLKLEAIYRSGQGKSFYSATGGFEYTFVSVFDTGLDLGIVGEWIYDDRGENAATLFENDGVLGLRLALNDAASTELLAGLAQDANTASRALTVEASRRIGSSVKASLEAWAFFDSPRSDILYSLRDDDFVKLELAYYY